SKRLEPAQHARVCTGRDRIEGVGERRLRDEPPVARGERRNEPPHEGERGRLGGVYPKRVPNQPDEPRDALRMLRALERRTHAREHGRLEQRREAERGGVPFEPLERGGRGEQRSGKLRREPLADGDRAVAHRNARELGAAFVRKPPGQDAPHEKEEERFDGLEPRIHRGPRARQGGDVTARGRGANRGDPHGVASAPHVPAGLVHGGENRRAHAARELPVEPCEADAPEVDLDRVEAEDGPVCVRGCLEEAPELGDGARRELLRALGVLTARRGELALDTVDDDETRHGQSRSAHAAHLKSAAARPKLCFTNALSLCSSETSLKATPRTSLASDDWSSSATCVASVAADRSTSPTSLPCASAETALSATSVTMPFVSSAR